MTAYKSVLFFCCLFSAFTGFAQTNQPVDLSQNDYVVSNLEEDSGRVRDKATHTLRLLKNGSVVVRLKNNLKNIEMYRKAGKNDVADRIESTLLAQNMQIYRAYKAHFTFCKVYFIYTSDTRALLDSNRRVFLNESLVRDTSIVMTDTFFVFSEYGTATAYSDFEGENKKVMGANPTETSTSPSSSSALLMVDPKTLKQYMRPFPSFVGVYLDNFNAAVKDLTKELEKAYVKQVLLRERKEQEKAKKKQAETHQ